MFVSQAKTDIEVPHALFQTFETESESGAGGLLAQGDEPHGPVNRRSESLLRVAAESLSGRCRVNAESLLRVASPSSFRIPAAATRQQLGSDLAGGAGWRPGRGRLKLPSGTLWRLGWSNKCRQGQFNGQTMPFRGPGLLRPVLWNALAKRFAESRPSRVRVFSPSAFGWGAARSLEWAGPSGAAVSHRSAKRCELGSGERPDQL